MAKRVYCVECQRLIRYPLDSFGLPHTCRRCVERRYYGSRAHRALDRAGIFARSADGRGQLGG